MNDVLKEYLVSLGFEVNNPSYLKFKSLLKEIDDATNRNASGMSASYIKAATAVVGTIVSVGMATIGLITKVADADLEYQKFAMHMFMSKDAAKEMKIAIDALGESVEDIAWMPELRNRYYELIKQQRQMALPKDSSDQFRKARDIRFELTRLRMEATYGLQWIGYNFMRHMAGPIDQIHGKMKGLNEWIQQNMPEWSDKIARGLVVAVGIGESVFRVFRNVFDGLKQLWDMLPDWGKKIAVVVGVALAPVSPMIKIVSAAILLIDDFFAYIDGRKSAKTLAPIWSALTKVLDFITRGIVATMVLLDGLYAKLSGQSKATLGDIIADATNAWSTIEGFPDREEREKRKKEGGPAAEEKKTMPIKAPAPATQPGTNMLAEMQARAATGIGNFQAMVSAPSAVPGVVGAATTNADNHVEIGRVEVNVTQPGATVKEVYEAARKGITDGAAAEAARRNREFAGAH